LTGGIVVPSGGMLNSSLTTNLFEVFIYGDLAADE
jgi:hypothetical protein